MRKPFCQTSCLGFGRKRSRSSLRVWSHWPFIPCHTQASLPPHWPVWFMVTRLQYKPDWIPAYIIMKHLFTRSAVSPGSVQRSRFGLKQPSTLHRCLKWLSRGVVMAVIHHRLYALSWPKHTPPKRAKAKEADRAWAEHVWTASVTVPWVQQEEKRQRRFT